MLQEHNVENPNTGLNDANASALQNEEFTLATDSNQAMQEMMNIIDDLRGITERETESLNKADTQAFLALQDEKFLKTRQYQLGMGQMMARKKEFKDLDEGTKQKLEDVQSEFSDLAKENLKALEKMQQCIERFGMTLVGAATKVIKQNKTFYYKADGKTSTEEAKAISAGGVSETA